MTEDHFKKIINYNHWADLEYFKAIELNELENDEKVITLFSHILNAQHIWFSRLTDQNPETGVWDKHELGRMRELIGKNFKDYSNLMLSFDPNASIDYSNSKGSNFNSTNGDILTHVINHSTYHRAQIASYIKGKGISPPVTDYIFWKRSQ